jgi:polyhydroxyalkanoate synthesis regulator phasin
MKNNKSDMSYHEAIEYLDDLIRSLKSMSYWWKPKQEESISSIRYYVEDLENDLISFIIDSNHKPTQEDIDWANTVVKDHEM